MCVCMSEGGRSVKRRGVCEGGRGKECQGKRIHWDRLRGGGRGGGEGEREGGGGRGGGEGGGRGLITKSYDTPMTKISKDC